MHFPGVQAGEVQEVVQERDRPVCALIHFARRLCVRFGRLPLDQSLRPTVDAGERVAQLVVHHREEQVTLALHGPNLAQQVLARLVEARVFNRDRRTRSEQHRDRFVFHAELVHADLFGEVEIADHLAPGADRHAQKRTHRRVVRRKTVALRMAVDVRGPDGRRLADHEAEQPTSAWEVPDPVSLGLTHPRCYELAQRGAVETQDAQRRITRSHDLPGGINDSLENSLQGMLGEDLDPGCEQTLEPLADSRDLGDLSPFGSASAGWASGASLRQGVPPSQVEAVAWTDVLSVLHAHCATVSPIASRRELVAASKGSEIVTPERASGGG